MKKGNFFLITGLLFMTAAVLLAAYNVWDDVRIGKTTNEILEQIAPLIDDGTASKNKSSNSVIKSDDSADISTAEIEYPDYILNPGMEMPVKEVDGKGYIGIISVPSINRELPVLSEWSYDNLKTAPCRYVGSVYLDNIVICAHNYINVFGPLENLNYGDAVKFIDTDGNVFTYEVIEIENLLPTETEKLKTGDWDLTLFTCTLSGTSRIVIRCEKTAS